MKILPLTFALDTLLLQSPRTQSACNHQANRSFSMLSGKINPVRLNPTATGRAQHDCGSLKSINPLLPYSNRVTTNLAASNANHQECEDESINHPNVFQQKNVDKNIDKLECEPRSLPRGSLLLTPNKLLPNNMNNENIKLCNERCTAVLMIPGVGIKPGQYRRLAEEIQRIANQPVWVVIPELPFDAPNPASTRVLVQQSIDAVKSAGYPGYKMILAGHSLGGFFLPKALLNSVEMEQIEGLIFMGSYTMRSARTDDSLVNHLPSLTISGELDGLNCPTRIAEDYYHHIIKKQSTDESKLRHAIVVVEGMNHMQFATGQTKNVVSKYDLESEISIEGAQEKVAHSVVDFIESHQFNNTSAQTSLLQQVNKTETFLQPLIDAMELEGSYHLRPPCHLINDGEACTLGSPWAEWAQTLIADANDIDLTVQDEFHNSWTVNLFKKPLFFHPSIDRIDFDKETDQLKMQLSTVSEAIYERLDRFDNSFVPNTAKEIRTKFNSRQAILRAAGAYITLEDTEQDNVCSKINEQTIAWAIEKAPEKTRQRYLDKGIQLVAGQDIEKIRGDKWVWSYLEFNKEINEEGREQRVLNSPMMKTPLDYPVPFSSGKHYCKLLSPARALGWIYTDSLRQSDPFDLF